MTDYSELPQVVHVNDERTFVINRGTESGVELGMNFLIFRLGDSISDPTTGEDLGVLEIVVGRARISHVQERMSTLESTMTKVVPGTTRRITRHGGGLLRSFEGRVQEDVEEGREVIRLSIAAEVGDYARPV